MLNNLLLVDKIVLQCHSILLPCMMHNTVVKTKQFLVVSNTVVKIKQVLVFMNTVVKVKQFLVVMNTVVKI